MMLRTPVIALAAAMCACSFLQDQPADTYTVYIDPAFTPDQVEGVLSVLQLWETETDPGFHPAHLHPVMLNMTCDSSCYDVITIHPSTRAGVSALALQWDGVHESLAGITHRRWHNDVINGPRDYSDIYIASDVSASDWPRIAMHEVGHALALSHTGPGTIMCASMGCASESITPADVKQYDSLR